MRRHRKGIFNSSLFFSVRCTPRADVELEFLEPCARGEFVGWGTHGEASSKIFLKFQLKSINLPSDITTTHPTPSQQLFIPFRLYSSLLPFTFSDSAPKPIAFERHWQSCWLGTSKLCKPRNFRQLVVFGCRYLSLSFGLKGKFKSQA